MTRRSSRSRKRTRRFEAPSISMLLPGTLRRGKRASGQGRPRPKPRRQRRASDGVLARVVARWRFSHYFALLLAVLAGVAFFLLLSDARFSIAQAQVTGNHYLPSDEILRRAGVTHANIFTLDAEEAAARVSLIPQVKEAHVRLGLPNRAVIVVIERTPVLNYVREGQMLWVDEEGHVFPAGDFRTDLPVLLDDDGSASEGGQHMNPALLRAMTWLSTVMPNLTEFNYRREYGLYFVSPEGWKVLLGDAEHMDEKLRRWETVHQQLLQQGRQVQSVDLRFQQVFVR